MEETFDSIEDLDLVAEALVVNFHEDVNDDADEEDEKEGEEVFGIGW